MKKVLVANRGEIAIRIIKSLKELGILTVSVFSEFDRKSLHVLNSDESYFLGPSISKESYLNQEKIIDIALKSKASITTGFPASETVESSINFLENYFY